MTKENHPIPGQEYLLIGRSDQKAISSGNDWHECLIKDEGKVKVQSEKQTDILEQINDN